MELKRSFLGPKSICFVHLRNVISDPEHKGCSGLFFSLSCLGCGFRKIKDGLMWNAMFHREGVLKDSSQESVPVYYLCMAVDYEISIENC